MAKKNRPHLVAWVGDLHAGSRWAACPPEVNLYMGGEEPSLYQANKVQVALWNDFQDFTQKVKDRAKGKLLILILGGDCIDGPHHHDSLETFGDFDDQIEVAIDMLLPLANVADEVYSILGTEGHSGQLSAGDRSVGKELGAKANYYTLELEVDGRLIHAKHHTSVSRLAHSRGNSLRNLGIDMAEECLKSGERRPDVMLRGHVHVAHREYLAEFDMWVATSGGWQVGTSYSSRMKKEIYDVGGAIYDPTLHKVELLCYRPQRTILHTKE